MKLLDEGLEVRLMGVLHFVGYLRARGDLEITDEELIKLLHMEVKTCHH